MANNYIARDSLLEKLQTTSIVTDDLYGMGIMSGIDAARKKDCQHLMFSDCYGECTKCHLGIVRPDDSCEFGERRATTHV